MIESQIIESFSNEATTSNNNKNSPIEDSFINSLTEGFIVSDKKKDTHKIVERFTSGTTTIVFLFLLIVIAYYAYKHLNNKDSL